MPESPKLPDQYHKSRLTTLVASTALFIISTQSPDSLSKFLPFGLHIEKGYQPFFIVALSIYALISLISLHLIFKDEVLNYLKKRQTDEQLADIDLLSTRSRHALSEFDERSSVAIGILSRINVEDLMVRATAEIHPDALSKLVSDAFAKLPVQRIVEKSKDIEHLLAADRNDIADDVRNALSAMSNLAQDLAYWHENVANGLMSRDNNGAWNKETLAKFTSEVTDAFVRSSSSLENLSNDLGLYVHEIEKGSFIRKVEYQFIGVWIPTVLFSIALVHAFGTVFGGRLHSLPFYVTKLINYLN